MATRLPFLPLGYGGDEDAWRVARVARELAETGTYAPSRPPGYPLFELVNALLVPWGGWLLTNGATLAVATAGVVLFARLLDRLRLPDRKLLLALYVLFPLLWTNSANTMDYAWALTCVLASYLALLQGRVAMAGLLLGAAVGFRPTSAVFVVPWAAHLVAAGQARRLPLLVGVAAASGLAAFSPPLLRSGLGAFSYYRPHTHELTHVPYYAVYTMGIPASLVTLVAAIRRAGAVRRAWLARDAAVVSSCTAVLVVAVLFCLVPQDRVYLLPLFPFLFLLLGRFAGRRLLVTFVVCALLYGFVKLEVKDPTSLDRVRVRPHLTAGAVIGSHRHRSAQLEFRAALAPYLRSKLDAGEPALFATGWQIGLPQVLENDAFRRISIPGVKDALYELRGTRTVVLIGSLDRASYAHFRDAGHRILLLEGSVRYAASATGFELDPEQEEMVALEEIVGG